MVSIKLFAMLRELAGAESLELPLPAGSTVGSLVGELVREYPALGEPFHNRKMLAVVNRRYAHLDDLVADGDEVAFLPPVSGG